MLNEERVKMMIKLASYEEGQGKEDFKVNSYYRKDYVSFRTIVRDPRETYLVIPTITQKTIAAISIIIGFVTKINPAVAAIPFPPLNFK